MKIKDLSSAVMSLSLVVLEVVEELDKEGASLSPLLLNYKKELSLLRDKLKKEKEVK